MSQKENKKWAAAHSKTYIAMSLCISDGFINADEKKEIQALCQNWSEESDSVEISAVMKAAAEKMMKAKKGTDLLDGVNRCAKQIAKEAAGSKKILFAFLKQLKTLAETDNGDQPVSESEARIIRYVARGFGFGQKLSVEVQDNGIGLIKN